MKKILIVLTIISLHTATVNAATYGRSFMATTTSVTAPITPSYQWRGAPIWASSFTATSTTATSTFANGINMTKGCFAINGTCVGGSGGSGTVTSVTATYPILSSQGTTPVISTAFGTTTANTFSALNIFNGNASTTQLTTTGSTYLATASGNVGIGTTSPDTKLDVYGDIASNSKVGIKYAAGNANLYNYMSGGGAVPLAFNSTWGGLTTNPKFTFNTNSGQIVTILDGGNVGVGTTTPAWLLNPFSTTASQLALSAGAGVSQWAFRNAGGNLYFATTSIAGTATTTTTALTILNNGRIGIGTSTPFGNLAIDAGVTTMNSAMNILGSINDFLQYDVKNTSTGSGAQAGYSATADNGSLISNFSWMGINNSSFYNPQAYNIGGALDVSFMGSGNDMYVANAVANKKLYFVTGGTSTTTNIRMTIDGAGNIGVGTSSPGTILSIGNTGNNTINISNTATSTFGTGINLRTGCFSVNGVCVGGGGSSASSTLLSDTNTWTGKNTFGYASTTQIGSTGSAYLATSGGTVGIGSTTPSSALSIQATSNANISFATSTGVGKLFGYVGIDATNPSLDLGTYTNHDIRFETNGLERLRILGSNGNVGIGTTSPTSKLSVQGAGYISSNLFVGGAITGTSTLAIQGTGNSYILGNVGIGTTSPDTKLDVYGDIASNSKVGIKYAAGNANLYNYMDGSGATPLNFYSTWGGLTTNPKFTFNTNSGQIVTILDGGNVGIGTTTPAVKLDINGYAKVLQTSTTTACSAAIQGSIFYNQANNNFWGCGASSSWTQLGAGSVSGGGSGTVTSVATDATLTGGTITTTGTLGLNLTNPNTWTGLQTINSASTTLLSIGGINATPYIYRSFTIATTTAWTGTTTPRYLGIGQGETWDSIRCATDVGTVNIDLYQNVSHLNFISASSTAGILNLSTNNTIVSGATTTVAVGTPASSPTQVTCTVKSHNNNPTW